VPATDPFDDLARYYDGLMETVDYDRWLLVTMALAELAPDDPFTHLDIACGTGYLAKRLRQHGWPTMGIDLSASMLRAGQYGPFAPPVAVADMRALPFGARFGYVTCLFDSINFLLDDGALLDAFRSIRSVLRNDGIFYFDLITDRMVLDHFADREWTEQNGKFQSAWESTYDHKSHIAETTIRINRQPHAVIRERVYPLDVVLRELEAAQFHVLGAFDAETWKAPRTKSIRLEIVAVPRTCAEIEKRMLRVAKEIRALLR
jgi:SAM-dependent methyltransferase